MEQICESDPIISISKKIKLWQIFVDFISLAGIVNLHQAWTSNFTKLKMFPKFDCNK